MGYRVVKSIHSAPHAGPEYERRKKRWAEARTMWIDGVHANVIARHVGVSGGAIYRRRKDYHWPERAVPMRTRRDWTRARAMWEAGEYVTVIARAVDSTRRGIYRAAERFDWPHRPSGSKRLSRAWPEALERWKDGQPTAAIAEFLDVTGSRVLGYARDHDWPKRRRVVASKKLKREKAVRVPKKPVAPLERAKPVEKFKGPGCPCGSKMARLVPVDGSYVYRCTACQPEWWAVGRAS